MGSALLGDTSQLIMTLESTAWPNSDRSCNTGSQRLCVSKAGQPGHRQALDHTLSDIVAKFLISKPKLLGLSIILHRRSWSSKARPL